MALVVFLRGVNVGGHRRFRPSVLARELSNFDVVNIGTAGTFVVWKPGSATKFRAALVRKLGFDVDIALCDGRDLIRMMNDGPFGTEPSRPDVVRFVSVLVKAHGVRPSMPITFPSDGAWLVRLIAYKGRFVFGEYRRHMKNNRLSWADRQIVRREGDHTELEHYESNRADLGGAASFTEEVGVSADIVD